MKKRAWEALGDEAVSTDLAFRSVPLTFFTRAGPQAQEEEGKVLKKPHVHVATLQAYNYSFLL